MKLISTRSRSTMTTLLLPCIINCSLIFLSLVFLTSAASSTSGIDLGDNYQDVVEEFKAKVLQQMGWSVPPKGLNASNQNLRGKLLREFFRKKLRANNHVRNFDLNLGQEDNFLDDLLTVVFPSTSPELWVPVLPVNTSPSPAILTSVQFSTNFKQPETPYHDLLVKSAILRMRISRQKRKLWDKDKPAVNMSFYLLSPSAGEFAENITCKLIHSLTVNNLKMKIIEIDIKPYLLSHIVESEDKIVTIGVKVETVSTSKHGDDNLKKFLTHSKQKASLSPSQSIEEKVRVSKASLRVTAQTKDLSKFWTKRQITDSSNCTKNKTCCRHSVYVDFADIGWSSFVLSPAGYTAYFCKGKCPYRYKIAGNFAVIKNILHSRSPRKYPKPVCAPTKYSSLQMIIYDGDEVKDVPFDGMVVSDCRCH